jgi:hypothetical protein
MTTEERISALENDVRVLTSAVAGLLSKLDAIQTWVKLVHDALTGQAGSLSTSPAEMLKTNPNLEIPTIKGPVKLQDVPLDASGWPTEDWAVENCLCEIHAARRAERDSGPTGMGQYL